MAFKRTKTNYNKMVFGVPRTVCFLDEETKKFEVVEFNIVIWDEKNVVSAFVKAEPVVGPNGNKYIHLLQEVAISSTKAVQEYLIPALLEMKAPDVFIAKKELISETFFYFPEEEMSEIINQLESMEAENDEM